MYLNEYININAVLDNLSKEIEKLNRVEYHLEVISQLDNIDLKESDREKIEAIKILVASYLFDIKEFIDYWNKYSRTYKMAVEKDVDKLQKELNNLKIKYSQLSGRYNQITDKEKQFNKNMETLSQALELINKNSTLISGVNGARKRMISGVPVARKTGIDDEELKQKYLESGCKITEEMVKYFNRKEKITYNGLRLRLISLGVWKGR